MSDLSTFLFARPSFFEGVGRILDFGNTMCQYNRSETPELADFYALWADWRQVGEDILAASKVDAGVQKVAER